MILKIFWDQQAIKVEDLKKYVQGLRLKPNPLSRSSTN